MLYNFCFILIDSSIQNKTKGVGVLHCSHITKKCFFIVGLITFSFFFVSPSLAARVIADDLYVAYPKSSYSYAIDISQSPGANYLSLITYGAHGRGNQLLGYEYRAEKDGYIIYSGRDNQQIIGSTSQNTAKVTQYTDPVNNYTVFDDSFIWDIASVGDDYYTIANRKTKTYLTVSSLTNDALIKLTTASNSDNQKFKLKTMNGIYRIRSFNTPSMIWDIKSGVGAGNDIISYPEGNNQDNQKWLILYKPNNNAYTISNFQQRNLIANQPSVSASPKVISNTVPYDTVYNSSNMFTFNFINETSDKKSIVSISNEGNPGYVYQKDSVVNNLSVLNLATTPIVISKNQRWILDKIDDIPKPEIKNLKLTGEISHGNPYFYVGEKINMTGDISGPGFTFFDLYSKFNINQPVLNQKNQVLNTSGTASFNSTIDTTDYQEGEFFIEVFARADSMFQSNRIATKTTLVYPTPVGEAVPQTIALGTPLSELDASKFVTNVSDEIGSTITIGNVTNIDTSKVGTQIAKISLKNKYKETIIDVPVTIENSINMSWSNDIELLTKEEAVDKSNLAVQLNEVFYWKSNATSEKYQVIVKKDGKQISQKEVTSSDKASEQVKETITIPTSELDYGNNSFEIGLYSLDNSTDNLEKIDLTITMTGSLQLGNVPTSLDWTKRNMRDSKGVLSRDKGNDMTLSVIDTRDIDDSKKTWSLRAKALKADNTPFDLIWKNTQNDAGITMDVEQQLLTKSNADEDGSTYKKTWNEETGVLLSSSNYLKSGNYDGKVTVSWILYDTPLAN